jgi:hypothetical protein
MQKAALYFLVLGCLSISGCDETTSTASDKFPDDIEDSITLDELGAAGYAKLCSTFEDYLYDQYSGSYFVQAMCTADAVENSADAESCGDSIETCLATPPPAIQSGIDSVLGQAGCSALLVDSEGCTATVRAAKQCLEDLESEVKNVRFTLTCAAFGQSLDDWDVLELPASCMAIENNCQ